MDIGLHNILLHTNTCIYRGEINQKLYGVMDIGLHNILLHTNICIYRGEINQKLKVTKK